MTTFFISSLFQFCNISVKTSVNLDRPFLLLTRVLFNSPDLQIIARQISPEILMSHLNGPNSSVTASRQASFYRKCWRTLLSPLGLVIQSFIMLMLMLGFHVLLTKSLPTVIDFLLFLIIIGVYVCILNFPTTSTDKAFRSFTEYSLISKYFLHVLPWIRRRTCLKQHQINELLHV